MSADQGPRVGMKGKKWRVLKRLTKIIESIFEYKGLVISNKKLRKFSKIIMLRRLNENIIKILSIHLLLKND